MDSFGVDGPVSEIGQLVATVLTLAAAVVVVALVVRVCLRRRDWMPAAVLAGGGLTFLLEPMFDHLYGLWFQSVGQWPLFTVYGMHLPLWLPAAYIAYYGGGAVFVWEKLRSGWVARDVVRFYAAMVGLAVVAEVSYIKIFEVYNYQDNQPFVVLGYPLFLAFVNSVSPVVAGVLAYRIAPLLRAGWKASVAYLVPLCFAMDAFGGGFLYLAVRHSVETPNPVLLWGTAALASASAVLSVKLVTLLLPTTAVDRRAVAGHGADAAVTA